MGLKMNRVLLINDNTATRDALQHHFAALGFSVMSVGSADASHAMEAAPDFILMQASTGFDAKLMNSSAWVYQLREVGPPELCAAPTATPNENTLFWHRRLQRALISSSLGIRTLPQNA